MIAELHGVRETVSHADNLSIRLYMNEEAENYPMHWHTDIEIICPLENIYTVVINEKQYILNPGDIIIIPSGELHELFAPQSGKRIIIQCEHSFLNNINGFDSIYNNFYPCTLIKNSEVDTHYQTLKSTIENITREYLERPPLCEASIYAMFIQFFVNVGRNCMLHENNTMTIKPKKQHQYVDKFLKVCKYINEHCTEDVTVDELSSLAGFSKFHFARLFQNFTGISYYEYLIKRRIMHAETLLVDPNISMVEIAMQSGFNNLATFNRNFKTIKKCTPSEYRAMYHQSNKH